MKIVLENFKKNIIVLYQDKEIRKTTRLHNPTGRLGTYYAL